MATKSDTSWRVQQPGRQVPETDDQSGSGYGARLDRLLTSRPCVPILTSPAASVHIRLFALSGLRRNRAIGPVLPRPGRDTAAPRPMAGDSGYNAGYERDSATGAVIVVSALTAIFDRHSLRQESEKRRMARQKTFGYNRRAKAEAAIARWRQAIGDVLRARIDAARVTGSDVAARVLNRMPAQGRPSYVRII